MTSSFFNLHNPLFWDILLRFLINLVFLFLLLRGVYYRFSRKSNYLFGFFLMGIVIFFIGAMLKIVSMEMGMAVGLFAIFTILNLRTISFDVKNMAYLFAVIAISATNSLDLRGRFPMLGIIVFNLIIIASAYILEYFTRRKDKYKSHTILYDNLEMLKPQNKKEFNRNVAEITGHNIKKIKILKVNYKDTVAVLEIFYED